MGLSILRSQRVRSVRTVQFLLLSHNAVFLIRIPVSVGMHYTQPQQGAGPLQRPQHARAFHTILDHMPTGPLDHPTTDRITFPQVHVILHVSTVVLEVADYLRQRSPFLPSQLLLGSHLLQALDDAANLSF